MTTTATPLRQKFFEFLFGDNQGHICIAYAPPTKREFKQAFFQWPKQASSLTAFIEQVSHGNNVWFCVSLLSTNRRKKEYALPGILVWADLDGVDPETIDPLPSCVVESSPGHYHVYWRINELIVPEAQEEFSRRLAYKIGADKSGWDLTQLLRVPYTYNLKPEYNGNTPPMVEILKADEEFVPIKVLEDIVLPKDVYSEPPTDKPIPDPLNLPDVNRVLHHHASRLTESFKYLYETEPGLNEDWSKKLWRLINVCFEIGMDEVETFVVVSASKCNKYARDNRPISHLWAEVLKAEERQKKFLILRRTKVVHLEMPTFVEENEIQNSFIQDYKDWAAKATDAPEVYHELSAVILLSAVLSPHIKLEFQWGTLPANLWGLILGESTLTRKTTAMEMARNILVELDSEAVLASDASPEGLISALSERPSRVSMFYRDEVTGFFRALPKQYMSDMPEILTKLYDVPSSYSRLLKKGPINISKPYFIFFGGGIKEKIFSLVEEQHIESGFIPRFLVVSGETNEDRLTYSGPPIAGSLEDRQKLVGTLADVKERYAVTKEIRLPGGTTHSLSAQPIDAQMDQQSWQFYNSFEEKLRKAITSSSVPLLAGPTFTRLGLSLAKVAMLFAAVRSEPKEHVVSIEEQDLTDAALCIQKWGKFSVELVLNANKPDIERITDKVLKYIRGKPGILQSEIFKRFNLRSKDGQEILDTLAKRDSIYPVRDGKGTRYYPTEELSD